MPMSNAETFRQGRAETMQRRRDAAPAPIAASLPAEMDVAAIRLRLRRWPSVTQDDFARRFGFSVGAVRDWEQGRRRPDGAARVLLALIAHNAVGVEAAIRLAIEDGNAAPAVDEADATAVRVRR